MEERTLEERREVKQMVRRTVSVPEGVERILERCSSVRSAFLKYKGSQLCSLCAEGICGIGGGDGSGSGRASSGAGSWRAIPWISDILMVIVSGLSKIRGTRFPSFYGFMVARCSFRPSHEVRASNAEVGIGGSCSSSTNNHPIILQLFLEHQQAED